MAVNSTANEIYVAVNDGSTVFIGLVRQASTSTRLLFEVLVVIWKDMGVKFNAPGYYSRYWSNLGGRGG